MGSSAAAPALEPTLASQPVGASRSVPAPSGAAAMPPLASAPVDELVRLATEHRVRGFASEAEATCDRALALVPDNPAALILLGELRADRGRFDEAHELFERVRGAAPGFAPAYASIASHRRMTLDDSSWLQGVQALLAGSPSPADEMQLRFALGKYFDDVGRYDEAFSSYQQANELSKRFGGRYDADYLSSLVGRILVRCDGTVLPRASDSDEPVFIMGMPRSGTSLAEQILASHPSVAGAGELVFWERAFSKLEDLSVDLAQEYLKRLHARVPEASAGALRITDKMPANFFYAGLIHAVLPKARIIHMQRHPLDTCLSIYFQNFVNVTAYANDLSHLAHFYGQYLRCMAHWRKVLPSQVLLEVPYEGLVQDPESWARRMVEFVGLPWDPRCLEFQQADRAVITASRWQVRQKIGTAAVGRWRRYERYLGALRGLVPGEVP